MRLHEVSIVVTIFLFVTFEIQNPLKVIISRELVLRIRIVLLEI